MKFALFGNTYQAKKSAHVERLLSILSQHNAEVHICREFYEFLTDDLKISIRHAGVFDGNNFEEKILNAQGTAVVDFWADWCGPCRMFSPIIEQFAAKHPEVTVGKINVDENPQLAEKYRVMGIPTLLVFRDGKVTATSVGVKPQKALEGMIG